MPISLKKNVDSKHGCSSEMADNIGARMPSTAQEDVHRSVRLPIIL